MFFKQRVEAFTKDLIIVNKKVDEVRSIAVRALRANMSRKDDQGRASTGVPRPEVSREALKDPIVRTAKCK